LPVTQALPEQSPVPLVPFWHWFSVVPMLPDWAPAFVGRTKHANTASAATRKRDPSGFRPTNPRRPAATGRAGDSCNGIAARKSSLTRQASGRNRATRNCSESGCVRLLVFGDLSQQLVYLPGRVDPHETAERTTALPAKTMLPRVRQALHAQDAEPQMPLGLHTHRSSDASPDFHLGQVTEKRHSRGLPRSTSIHTRPPTTPCWRRTC
jgi:hypothetical protein